MDGCPLGRLRLSRQFLALVFLWRASVSWLAVSSGAADKAVAATLISAMLGGSILLVVLLLRGNGEERTRSEVAG